jgi:hypothetical protein
LLCGCDCCCLGVVCCVCCACVRAISTGKNALLLVCGGMSHVWGHESTRSVTNASACLFLMSLFQLLTYSTKLSLNACTVRQVFVQRRPQNHKRGSGTSAWQQRPRPIRPSTDREMGVGGAVCLCSTRQHRKTPEPERTASPHTQGVVVFAAPRGMNGCASPQELPPTIQATAHTTQPQNGTGRKH